MAENPQAFPIVTGDDVLATGMELRDWFAGQIASAMAAELYQQSRDRHMIYENVYTVIAGGSYELADAMLKARTTT